jgi:hypothetical protein
MQTYWIVLVAVWIAFAAGVSALAIYRKFLSREEMDLVHFHDTDAGLISGQKDYADRLDWIDTWGKRLTIVALVYGLILFGIYVYQVWQASLLGA